MALEKKQVEGYGGRYVQGFQYYLKHSQEHKVISAFINNTLSGEIKRIGAGKGSLDVLGVGSGGGELDAQILSVVQSVFPALPVSADVVEPSTELSQQFKALTSETPSLQKVPFAWHIMTCADYESQVKAGGEAKTFDLIHMIQMLYYVDDYAATIKFFHSLLKKNSKLLIVHEAADSGWDILWKTYRSVLCTKTISDYLSAGDIKVHLDQLGLRYEEHRLPNTLDITEVFTPGSGAGELLLDFMTEQDHFHQSLSPEVRAGILELLKTKCSTERDGRVLFDCSMSGLLVYA